MKRKLLFITLLMLFCSTVFGQQQFYWQPPGPGSFQDQMSISAIIQIDGENPNRSDLEMAAFCNGVVRGSAKSIIWPGADGNTETLVVITIQGNNKDELKFKLYVPGDGTTEDRILDTDFTIDLDTEYHGSLETLNFYEKHFVVDNEYDLTMTVGATVRIDGVDPKRTDLELAAFCGDEVRGVAKAIYWQSQDMYYYELTVGGRSNGEEITYKLYDPIANVDLLTDYKTIFEQDATIDDGNGKPVAIEFKNNPVAMITDATGNHYFSTLEAAVEAAQNGETVVLLQDVNLTETLTIEKNITLDLNDKNVTLSTGGNMIKSNVIIRNGNLAIADVDTKETANSNCFISTEVDASLTFDDINMTGNGYKTHWAVLCAMTSSTAGSTINITNSTVTLSNEKGSKGGFIKDQSGVDNYSQINVSNSILTLNNVSRGFTGAKVTLDKVNLTITGGEHGINGSELVIKNSSNVSISNGTGRAITLNKFDASIAGSNVTISNMGEGGIRYKTANTLTVDANSTLSETTAHADVDNAKLNDKVVRGKESQMSTVKVENGVTTVINPVSGQVAYRAYIEDSENREAVKVDLQNVNALNSLAVKLYDANGNLLTTTTYKAGAVEAPEYLTCNIVLSGTASSSWGTVISAEKLTVDNYPHEAELVVDGNVINTFENILGNATDAAAYQLPAYKALGCVYKAASITREGKTEYYGTLAAAVNAAQDGDEIVLLDNVTDVDATINKNITLNLNEKIINDAYIIVKSEVNIKNGSIKNVNESYPLVVQDGGKLTVDAVNIEASKSDRAIWVRSGSSLVFNSGSILATKGEYNTKTSLIAAIYTDTNTDVTINGGTITVDTPENKAIGIFGNYTNANVIINGGKISTSGENYCYAINVDGDITVTGGEIVTNEKGYGYSSGIRYGNNYALVTATGNVTISGGKITTNSYNGYIVSVGRSYDEQDQTVTITGGEFKNNLSEVENTTGGHKAPVLVWDGSESATVEATISNGQNGTTPKFEGFNEDLYRPGKDGQVINPNSTLLVSGGTFDVAIEGKYIAPGFKLEENENGTYGVVVDPAYGKVAKIGDTYYEKLADAIAAVQEGQTIELLPVTIEQGTVKLPATLKNVTVKGAEDHASVLKDMTIMAHDGNSINYEGITFDGIVFENSRISVTGWRNNGVVVKDFTVTNCLFFNLNDETNVAPVHFNMAATEPVNGFTFTNNVIDGATGGSKSGVYAQMTGKVIFTNNTINNVSFRPYVIQLTTDDGIDDEFTVTGNTFSGSAAGRAQALTNNAEGTDEVELTVSNNIFKGITAAQQICYWKFNEATTTATLEKNYYDIDVMANPGGIYYNSAAQNITDLSEIGIFPIYTELNGDGTIDEESLFDPVAYVGTKAFETLDEAFAGQDGTIVLLKNIELTEGLTVAAGKTFTLDLNGKVVSGVSNTAATSAVITNNGNLTVKTSVEGGKITSKANNPDQNSIPAYANNTITNCGVLTLLSGTIENSTEQGLACFPIDNNSTVRDAVLNINGGTVTGRGAIRQFANSNTNKNEVKVTAGTVTGTSYAIWVQNPGSGDPKASLNIEGGELSKILMDPNANFEGSIKGGTITEVAIWEPDATNPGRNPSGFITGGTFGMDVTEFCAFNYVCTSNGDGTYGIEYKQQENNAFVISTLHELEAFRNAVNAGNTFAEQTVVLSGGVDLNPTRAINIWEPIGTQANPFKGTFDGGDNTISNLVVEGENNVGLFGYADNATIKNVKLENVNVKGTNCVGAIAGQVFSTSLIDNCHVSGSIKVEGQTNVGGIVGKYYTKVTNSSVIGDGVATSYVKGTHKAENFEGDNIGGIMGHGGENNTFTNNTVKNITISGTRKVGGIVGVTDQNTDVTNCVVENVNIETTAKAEYAQANAAKAGHASIVGSYTKLGANNNGTVTNCVVKNVTFVNNDNVTMSAGPITGGAREGMVDPTGVTASGNLVYMSTITGNTTNMYLMHAVAQIDENKYYTLQDAVDAGDGETINVILSTTEDINIADGATITLTFADDVTLNGYIAPFNGNLTVNGGTINNTNSGKSAIEINAGNLELNNVNISSARHALRLEGINGEVNATINGGTYKAAQGTGTGTYHAINAGGDGSQVTVTITDGTFVGPKGTTADSGSAVNVQTGSTVTIEGGNFSGGKNATLGVSGTMIVKGGTFDQDPSAYLADAYTVNIENEMYVVRYTPIMVTYPVGNPVYPEGKVEYYSDMLEAVPYTTDCPRLEGATITLLADVSGAGMRFMENDMVFDLNGHTYTITDGTGSQGTNTSGFQIRPEVTTNVLFKDGTIKVAEGAPVVWMFNCYATDFIVENVTVDCSNMAYSYGEGVYVVVSRSGDNVQLKGQTKIANFNSTVAGYAINVGGTMTIGEYVDLGGGTIELDGGAQLTAPAGLNVVTVGGYMVVYENGVYKSVKVVAQVGDVKYESVAAAMTAAKEAGVKDLEITIIGENTQDTDDSFNLVYATAFDNVTIKQDNDNKPFYIESIYTGDRTSTDGKFVFDGVNMIITGQIWFECDVVLTNNSSVKRSDDAKNFIYYGEVTVEPGSKYISQIDDVYAGSFTVDGGKTDGTYNEAEDFKTVFFDVRDGHTFTAKNGANILISSGEGGKLSLMGNANIDASKVYVYNEIALGDNGQFAIDIESSVTTKNVTGKGVISVDALNINEGVVYNVITANMSSFAGIIEINNDDAEYEITSTGLVVKMKPFVAQVEDEKFTSLQAAIDAADGKTVVVLDNITLTETVTVAAGTTVTLDLNGKTVSAGDTFAAKAIRNDGVLTINGNGGTIDISASTTESIQVVDNYGTLTINGGTYKGATSNYSYAIRANDANSVTNIVDATITTHFGAIGINKGVTTITDGKFEVTSQAGGHALYVVNAEVTINGGEFIPYANGYSYAVLTNDANAKVSITGGTFKKGLGDSCVKALSGNIIITGGTFSTDVNEYCHEYYDAVTEDNITWTVEQVLFAQTTELQAGWNWYSSYVDINGEAGWENLKTGLGSNAMLVKNQNSMSQYYNTDNIVGWDGTLEETSVKEMYMIRMSADHDLTLTGKLVDPSENPITLHHNGWTWIGYPMNQEMSINDALRDLENVKVGDHIKGIDGYAEYYGTEYGWWGSLETMVPGKGYMYHNNSDSDYILTYSYLPEGVKSELRANITTENNYWVPASSQYANNMNITAFLSIDGVMASDNYEVAAFVGGEVRGSARPIYVEPLDTYMFFLTVHGEDVEEMTFKCYDLATGEEHDLNNRMNYSNDAVVGSIGNPYLLSRGTTGIGESAMSEVNIYPNPTTTGSEVNLGSVCDTVEVFNALGVKVAEYQNVDTIDALETAGIYVIRITNNGNVQNCRLIVK